MAGAPITGDVSIGNVNEVLDDSCGRRCVGDSYGAIKYSNVYERTGNVPEHSKFLPGVIRDNTIVPDIHALRIGMTGPVLQEAVVKDTRSKGENEVIYLRDKVSSLFRENCSLKEQAAKLGIDNRSLQKQASGLKQENVRLREKLQQISQQLKSYAPNKEFQPHMMPIPLSGSYDSQRAIYDSKLISYKDNSGPGQFYDKFVVNKMKTSNDSDNFVTGISSQVTLPMMEQLNGTKRKSPQLNQMVDTFSNEEINSEEKDVLNILESIQNNSTSMREIVLAQNKWLMEKIENVSSAKLKLDSEQTKTIKNDSSKVVSSVTNFKPDVPKTAGTSVDQLFEKYGAELVQWVGEQNGTICGEYGDSGNQIVEDEWICPMCQAAFPKSVPLPEFETHVMDHFKSDEFEIIPHDGDFS